MSHKDESLHLDNQLCFPLYATSRLITRLYAPALAELDITYPQYLVLLVLWQADEVSVTFLSNKLYLESNTLTPLLKRMEQKKLILRKRNVKDERQVMISLTGKGRKLKAKAYCIPEKVIDSLDDEHIDATRIPEFKSMLALLMGKLAQQVEKQV